MNTIPLTIEEFWKFQCLEKQVRLAEKEAEIYVLKAQAIKAGFVAELNEKYADLDLTKSYVLDERTQELVQT